MVYRTGLHVGAAAALLLGASAATAAPINDDPAYAHQEHMVRVEGARRLNLYCIGHGSPTVVFESGLSEPSVVWAYVQPAIAKDARACVYDRAGMGFSDASPHPASAANIVADLHRLLTRAGVRPPYALVGHSVGGAYVRLFADDHPSEVVGMVLVDPVHEDEEVWDAIGGGAPSPRDSSRLARFRECVQALEVPPHAYAPGSPIYRACVFGPDPRFGPNLTAAVMATETRPAYQRAQLSEFENGYSGVSFEQVRVARRFYGDMPLIVLSRTVDPATLPAVQQTPSLRILWELHEELTALSSRGEHRGVANTSHDIEIDQPGAVDQAVEDVLAEARGR
jgi:pimeloyl-ACP methyl ester carboxylesterase